MLFFNGSSKALNDTDEFLRGTHDEIEAGSCSNFVIGIRLCSFVELMREQTPRMFRYVHNPKTTFTKTTLLLRIRLSFLHSTHYDQYIHIHRDD